MFNLLYPRKNISYSLSLHIPYILACIFCNQFSSVIYRREDCILIFVFMSVPIKFFLFRHFVAFIRYACFWKYFSYIFPFFWHECIRICEYGCELSDIRNIYIGIWVQVIFYFITSLFDVCQTSKKDEKK